MAKGYAVNLWCRITLLAIILFLFHPIILFISRVGLGVSATNFIYIFKSAEFWEALQFTLTQASISTLGALLLGMPGAYLLSRYNGKFKRVIHALLTIPLMLPVIFVVLGFVIALGENGWLNRFTEPIFGTKIHLLYSLPAIIIAHIFYNAPIVTKFVGRAWESVGRREEEAALLLCKRKSRIFWMVTLPKLKNHIVASCGLVFIFCYMSFAIPLILGGGPAFSTLEVLIYEKAKIELNFPSAIGIAMIELIIAFIFLTTSGWITKYSDAEEFSTSLPGYSAAKNRHPAWWGYIAIAALWIGIPIAALFLESIFGSIQNITIWNELLNPKIFHSAKLSLTIGLGSALLATTLGTTAVIISRTLPERGSYDIILFLPTALSGVLLGMGYLLSYQPILLAGGGVIVLTLLHATMNFPFAYKTVRANINRLSPAVWDSAMQLSHKKITRLQHITIPLLKTGILNAILLTFALSLGEFTATAMIAGGRLKTIPIMIYELLGAYRLESAALLGTLFMLLSFAIFYLIERSTTVGEENALNK